ncbi:uncharacterized protein [Eucyclogobius newberryi]|uniref:uncharacterized protein n=1 Tax=Eucyclogobius newberryi TaxID=166745 RepID=UPI003B5A1D52
MRLRSAAVTEGGAMCRSVSQRNKMAAVAREPGAAAVLTVPPPEPRPPDPACSGLSLPGLPPGLPEPPGPCLCAVFSDKDEDRFHVSIEANATELQSPDSAPELTPLLRDSAAGKGLSDHGPGTELDPVQSAVSPLSLPAALEAPEAGLSLGQPNGPDRACTERTMTGSPDRTEPAASLFTALREPAESRREDSGEQAADRAQEPAEAPEPGSELRPGTQVRVSLDHVIDDALVVSFCVGHKVFSGVLMDLSRRFGPYGIPISTFPPRRESSRRHVPAPPPLSAEDSSPDPTLTPLFHQGAPYPPPLFLRDTYHQSLPQPPPRRIKRSRRRYGNSEEPTCMLVRLRPRQVLCDRCKGVAGPRPAPSARRRPNPEPLDENLPAEVKRLRCDDARPTRARRDPPKGPGTGAGAPNPAPRRPTASGSSGRDQRSRDTTRSNSLRSAPNSLRTGPGSGLRSGSGSGLRSSSGPSLGSNSGGAAGSRVLTRRISSALSPPRIRLKPHRYRTDPEPSPPPLKTRPRPGPRLDPGPQRTSKNSAKTLTKPSSRPQNRSPSREEARPGSKPGSKAETRPGTRTETRIQQKDQNSKQNPEPDLKAEVKSEYRPESENSTKTLLDQDPEHPEEHPTQVLKPDPDSESCSDPDYHPVLPSPSPSRSRRKQVFPRPTQDFDLDFIGWPDPDKTGPDQDRYSTKPGPDPKPETKRNSDEVKFVCKEKAEKETQLESSETEPGLDQRPKPGPEPNQRSRPVSEPDPESDSELCSDAVIDEKEFHERPKSLEGSEVPTRSSPGPKSGSSLPEPGSNPDSINGSHEPENRTVSETIPEPMEMDSNPSPDHDSGPNTSPDQDSGLNTSPDKDSGPNTSPDQDSGPNTSPDKDSGPNTSPDQDSGPNTSPEQISDQALPESWSKESPTIRSRSGSVVDSRPSSPGSSSGSRSRPSSRTESRASEQSQCSTRSSTKSICKPPQKLSHNPGSRPDPRPMSSRAVPKVVGADGRCVCVGDIVWAKIAGFPWWPARVLSLTVSRHGDGGGVVKQEVRVAWFGSRTTSVLPLSLMSPFLETFQARFDRKRRGPYRRAIAEAASAAKQLTPEVRALITQFET